MIETTLRGSHRGWSRNTVVALPAVHSEFVGVACESTIDNELIHDLYFRDEIFYFYRHIDKL